MTELGLIAYGVLKIAAYAAVCAWGLRSLAAHPSWVLHGIGLGFLRAGMGLLFGIGIFLASAAVVARTDGDFGGQLFAYLVVYVPTRWIEWSLFALIIERRSRSLLGFLLGSSSADRSWRLAGIAVSCTADIPVLLAVGGLPIGRFMC